MATYNRGRHILPSVRSVLGQDTDDWELLVVGDACTDETEAILQPFLSDRVRWMNLDTRVGSQSGPNNAGIAAARAPLIAYLGHDDIWEPFHLSDILHVFRTRPEVDFVSTGRTSNMPHGMGMTVGGLYESHAVGADYHHPPSCLAHRKRVIDRIGGWRSPHDIIAQVDADFLMRAYGAGMIFGTTGRVSMHKFLAAHRYLSYVRPDSDEQEEMLRALGTEAHRARMAERLAVPRELPQTLSARFSVIDVAPGELYRGNLERKGLDRPPTQPLGQGARIVPTEGKAAFDWVATPAHGFRWNLRSPRPRILLPYTAIGPVQLEMTFAHFDARRLDGFEGLCNDDVITFEPVAPATAGTEHTPAQRVFRATVALLPDGPSILELRLREEQLPKGPRRRIGIGDIVLWPLAPPQDAPAPEVQEWRAPEAPKAEAPAPGHPERAGAKLRTWLATRFPFRRG
jgi:hypothetical protein